MGIIKTNEWLDLEFDRPLALMKRIGDQFSEANPEQLYRHLQKHGMYKPNEKTKKTYNRLVERDVWGKTEQFFSTYKQLWNGPDVPVYMFPMSSSSFLQRASETKSGLAFRHSLFLFFDGRISDKEIEAVLIHEYHHVCRLHRLKNKKNTLLDTMVMEGLAERTVAKYLGSEYLAHWTKLHRESDFKRMWTRYLEGKLLTERSNPLHDHIMLGRQGYPHMLGYWSGYQLVKNAGNLSVKQSFSILSEELIKMLSD
jgi:uncharacterized protein YjaZ